MVKVNRYRYLFINDELSIPQKIVQASHVSLCTPPDEEEGTVRLVLGVEKTADDLLIKSLELSSQGIGLRGYRDREYHGNSYTCIVTDVVEEGSPEHKWLQENTTLFTVN